MISIALYNIKGGVGKTAASVNLAYLAALTAKKTLVWDLDPQGAASFYFNSEAHSKAGLRKIMESNLSIEDYVQPTHFKNLWMIPAAFGNRHLDVQLDEIKQSTKKLKKLIGRLAESYDYLFLDCPPGIGILSETIFSVADVVLMPAIPTTLSIRTYEMTKDFFQKHEISPEKLLCFFNMADTRKRLHSDVISHYYGHQDFLKTYIPYLSVIEKMGESMAPVAAFAPSSYGSQCFRDLWQEVQQKIM